MKRFALGVAAALVLLSTGCGGPQSIVNTANPAAGEIEGLWWIALVSTGALSILVFGGLFQAVRRARRADEEAEDGSSISPPDADEQKREDRWILLLGAVLPTLFLTGFLVVAVRTGISVAGPPAEPALTVEVTGHMFWWEIVYPDHGIATANELHIPVGEPVEVRVTSADVIHSFWVPKISPGKVDMVPGRTNVIWMSADEPGDFRGQCTEFCGVQHALMSMLVIASEAEEFDAWIEAHSRPQVAPDDPELQRGQAVFFATGCGSCHALDGRPRAGRAGSPGPDLFRVSSRTTLGALTVENTRENLADFIVDPHDFKPGVRMPPHPLADDDLSALVSYLESLGR